MATRPDRPLAIRLSRPTIHSDSLSRLRQPERVVDAGHSPAFRIVQDLADGLDLIVSDIEMPNGDGLSLAHAVKNSFPDVPVILVSGNSKPDEGFEFVKKPFVPSTLVSAIRKVAH